MVSSIGFFSTETIFTRSATIPARSDTVLVSSTSYNQRGEPFQSIDPAAKEDRTTFDDAARRIELVENYVDPPSSPGSGNGCAPSDDENATVQFTYTPDGEVHEQIVINAETSNQVTQYVYGTTLANSEIASSRLLREVIYPDSVSGTDRVKHRYNRQGELIETTDQNQTEHAFDYDLLGRRTQDRVVTLGSGVDGAVQRIETAYNKRGNVEGITSFDSASTGSGSVVNEVVVLYNDFRQAIETL